MTYIPPGQTQYAYEFLKARFNSVLRSYRVYKTPLIYEIKKWRAKEMKDPKTQAVVSKFFDSSKSYQQAMKAQYQTPASKPTGITTKDQQLLNQLRNALTSLSNKVKR